MAVVCGQETGVPWAPGVSWVLSPSPTQGHHFPPVRREFGKGALKTPQASHVLCFKPPGQVWGTYTLTFHRIPGLGPNPSCGHTSPWREKATQRFPSRQKATGAGLPVHGKTSLGHGQLSVSRITVNKVILTTAPLQLSCLLFVRNHARLMGHASSRMLRTTHPGQQHSPTLR